MIHFSRASQHAVRTISGLMLCLVLAAGAAQGHLRILTTILPLKEFASAVAGERGEAALLLPPGAGVHTWQPRPGDLIRLTQADLFIYIGAGLEPWVSDILKSIGPRKIRSLEAGLQLPLIKGGDQEDKDGDSGHGFLDPHVWLDFSLDEAIVTRIAETLAIMDPDGRPEYTKNAAALKEKLRALDTRYKKTLAGCQGRTMVVAGHAAFGYLARRYGLRQVALHGTSPDSQPGPRWLMEVVKICKDEGVKAIFLEPSVPPDLARTLAGETGTRIFTLHPGHTLTREQIAKGVDFFDIMEENLRNLEDGLCR